MSESETLADYIKTENARELREARGDLDVIPDAKPVDLASASARSAGDAGDGSVTAKTVSGSEAETERDPATGQFKAKPKDGDASDPKEKQDFGGDPRKDPIAKLNRERWLRGEAERKAKDLEAKLAAVTVPSPAAPAPAPQPKTETYAERVQRYQSDPAYPGNIEDFASFADPYQAMVAAQGMFIRDKGFEEHEAKAQAEARAAEANDRVKTAHDAGAEKYADWGDLMASDQAQVDLSPAVLRELYADPSLSADLIHHVLTHPDDLESLAQVTDPIAAARLVGKLSAALSAAPSGPAATARPVTRAKPLIKPVSGSPAAPETTPPEDLPFGKQYIARMNAKERKEREALRG